MIFHSQENILLEPMFEVPGSDVVDVIIDKDVVFGKSQAQYIRRPRTDSSSEKFEPEMMDEENFSASNSRVI